MATYKIIDAIETMPNTVYTTLKIEEQDTHVQFFFYPYINGDKFELVKEVVEEDNSVPFVSTELAASFGIILYMHRRLDLIDRVIPSSMLESEVGFNHV